MSDSENEDGVFENIAEQMKNKFVTKKKYSRKVTRMKRELQKKDEELQKMRAEYDREKLKNDIRGVLNFSAKSIRRRICHVNACACRHKF